MSLGRENEKKEMQSTLYNICHISQKEKVYTCDRYLVELFDFTTTQKLGYFNYNNKKLFVGLLIPVYNTTSFIICHDDSS